MRISTAARTRRGERDAQIGAGETALRGEVERRLGRPAGAHGRASTITLPHMVWCAIPQYSWQTNGYSPGRSKRAVTRAIWPGRSMTFTLWRSTWRPWTTSRLVATNVTVDPAGTRTSFGVKVQIPATILASYWPGPVATTPG